MHRRRSRNGQAAMIGIDWGTSSLRAFRLRGRAVTDRREAADGITMVAAGAFSDTLRAVVADWLAEGETHILMAGMIGSRQGWQETAYLPCPAGPADLAAALQPVAFPGATVAIVPGLSHRDEAGVPEVMRGEETQLVGAAMGDGLFCLPGTHAKWATVAGGRITGFTTAMTGEVFAAIRQGTILGRMMPEAPHDAAAFRRGLDRVGTPGGLLHHLFGVRTLILLGELAETGAASYLSGLLIGTEVAAVAPAAPVHLIGDPALCRLYAEAMAGRTATSLVDPDAAALGLALIAEHASWN